MNITWSSTGTSGHAHIYDWPLTLGGWIIGECRDEKCSQPFDLRTQLL